MGELGYTFNGLNGKSKDDFGHGSAKYITYMNVYKNPIATLEELDLIEIDKSQNEIKKGDILFTTSSETPEEVGLSSVWMYEITNIYVNSFCFGFRLEQKISINYMAYMLRSNSIRNKITLLAQGISRYNISKKGMMNIEVFLPSYAEQTQIGNFFKQLDDTIALHQRELEKFKILKTSYLENIFLGKVSLFTAKNTITWEQRKFLDNIESIIDFRGRTPRKLGMEWGESGYLALSALNVKNGYIDPSVDAHFGDEALYQKWMTGNELKQGQVLFTTEAPMGNVAQIPDDKKYILSQRTIAFNIKEKYITDDFLAVLLRSPNVFNDLDSLSSGGTAKGISQKSLSNLYVKVPNSLEEQTQIGNFFKQLDDTIALHQKELAKYQQIKTACLEKMFME